tara:strand:+ start:210 stop:1343 length:1134 start_codon:yes stop_codon:yes gene_type:complete
MKKHKICIIGDGLTGLTAATALNNLGLDVELYHNNKSLNINRDKRITAISNSNLEFFKKIVSVEEIKTIWPCKQINLYYEKKTGIINFLNFKKKSKFFLHIFQNYYFKNFLFKNLKRNKVKMSSVKIDKVDFMDTSIKIKKKSIYYDLIILCVGNKSSLYKNFIGSRIIKKDYKQTAITGFVNHKLKLNDAAQYFLKEGPLAFLPFKKNTFSYVWSLENKYYKKNKKNLKNLLKKKLENLLNSKKFSLSKVQSYPLHLSVRKKYYNNNTLILGEGLHSIHPIAGQGFNLVMRDIIELYKIINKNISLGLEIKDSLILKDLNNQRRPENTIFSIGVDLTNTFFKKNKYFGPLKDLVVENVSKIKIINKISQRIADKGL